MRVLIIDDQAANRMLLSDMVQNFGYQCLTVASGQEALLVLGQFKPDIVLLDVVMPDLGGIETVPHLKLAAGQVHLPVIFITALDDQVTLLKCLDAGGDDFIGKPFEPVVLEAKLLAHGRTRELSKSLAEKNEQLAYHSSRVEREHQIVEHIFQNSLTRNHLNYPHLQTYLSSMSMFNGDVFLAAPGPLGNMYFLLGDFTGHGLSAAVGALPTSQTFFKLTGKGASVGEVAREINQHLHQLLPTDMFLAASILELSASGERITYWNGGMPPALLITGQDQVRPVLEAQHLALGILTDEQFECGVSTTAVRNEELLLLFSDGVIELPTENGELLGIEGLGKIARTAEGEMCKLTSTLHTLMNRGPQTDDISLALLHCKPTGIPPEVDNSMPSPLSFKVELSLDGDDIRQLDPVNRIVSDFTHIEGFARYKAHLFTVLSETYNNAVEHGLLELDSSLKNAPDGFEVYYKEFRERLSRLHSGQIDISVAYDARRRELDISITDSGKGFRYADRLTPECQEQFFGRGLRLVEEMTTNLHWRNGGRTVAFTLPLRA